MHILRSHHGLSTTYHRLVFGLSIGDILSSFFQALSFTMMPKKMNYYIPYTQGNTATCDAQGFLVGVGIGVGVLCNCSIYFYYLAIIRCNKKDEYIRDNLEPWFHGISIVLPLLMNFILIVMKGYKSIQTSICSNFALNEYPHCIHQSDTKIHQSDTKVEKRLRASIYHADVAMKEKN